MKGARWLLDHWYVPLFFLAAVVGWLVHGKKGPPAGQLKAELDAISAGAEARKLEAQLGKEQAVAKLREEHDATLKKLDEERFVQAKELENDPAALARFLVRAARS